MRVRSVVTASKKHALQVVSGGNRHLTVHKHLGSYSDASQKQALFAQATTFIKNVVGQTSLLKSSDSPPLTDISITGNQPLFLYRLLADVYQRLGLTLCPDPLIQDLVIARIYKPVSKRATRDMLAEAFNRHYSLITIYRHLNQPSPAA